MQFCISYTRGLSQSERVSEPRRRTFRMALALLCIAVCSVAGQGAVFAADDLRWGILAGPDVERSGLGDLLTVELSRSVKLVERDAIQDVLKEVELSQFGAAQGVGLRLRVGPKFKADRLIVLTVEEVSKDARNLKCVVCDTHLGTRLLIERKRWPPEGEADGLAKELASSVDAVRRRFADGVQQIVGVQPLLSRNLLHNYDYLQQGLATLLMESLLEYPGVAVLELEEYRALGDELRLNAVRLEDRVVRLLVEGEFESSEQGVAVAPADLKLNVTLSVTGANQRTLRRDGESLGQVTEWLRDEVPRNLLESSLTSGRTLSADEQFARLAERADAFSDIALWEEAIALRESALLLKDDFLQHLKLIGDYHRCVAMVMDKNRISRNAWVTAIRRSREESEAYDVRQDKRLLPLQERYTQLVTQRISAGDLNMEEGGILWSSAFMRIGNVRSPAAYVRSHELSRQFFWDNIGRLRDLDNNIRGGEPLSEILYPHRVSREVLARTPGRPSLRWTNIAMIYADDLESRNPYVSKAFSSQRMFDDVERFLREASPWPVPSFIRHVFPNNALRSACGDYDRACESRLVAREEFDQFYQRLADSQDELMRWYGRVGLLGRRVKPEMNGPQKSLDAALLDDIEQLQREMLEYCRRTPGTGEAGAFAVGMLDEALGIITQGRNPWLRSQAPQEAARIAKIYGDDEHGLPIRELPVTKQIRFEPLGGQRATWDALVACGPSLDVVYSDFELWLMPRPGVLQSILTTDSRTRDYIQNVHWDGRWIWVSTRTSGLRVFTPSGQLVGHLPMISSLDGDISSGTTGIAALPPGNPESMRPSAYFADYAYRPAGGDPAFQICPMGDGRCVAVGQFGTGQRTWVCSLKLTDSGEWTVKLVHSAVRVGNVDIFAPSASIDSVFRPSYLVPAELPGRDSRRAVVIGRGYFRTPPLVLDPATDRVSLFTLPFQSFRNGFDKVPIINGNLAHGPFSMQDKLATDREAALNWQGASSLLVPSRDGWYRLHRDPLSAEWLPFADEHLKPPYVLFATSSHFGHIVWRPEGEISRVVIEPAAERVLRTPVRVSVPVNGGGFVVPRKQQTSK